MAVSCIKNFLTYPENKVHRFGEGREQKTFHDEKAIQEAARVAAEQKEADLKKQAQERVEASELLPESIKRLNEVIQDAPPSTAEVILTEINAAIEQLGRIDTMKKDGILDDEGYAIALELFDEAYVDFKFSQDEIRTLAQVRRDTDARLDLKNAHKVNNLEGLKQYALTFLRDKNGKNLPSLDDLADGETFTVDFKDPTTGSINTFAQKFLTLGHILQTVRRKAIDVIRPDGKKVIAHLWSDGKTYDQPEGSKKPKNYVKILEGYQLVTSKEEPRATAQNDALDEDMAEYKASRASEEPGESYNPDYTNGKMWVDPEEYAAREKADAELEMTGGLAYHRNTEISRGTTHGDFPIETEADAEASDVSLASLSGKSVEVPAHFRGENSYEQIEKIKSLEGGQAIYDAIRMMAAIHRETQGLIDNRNMWQTLRGSMLRDGGRFRISFNEMAKAVYGKGEDKLSDSDPHMKEFKAAANALLTTLAEAEQIDGVDANSYKAQREKVEYKEEQADMARLTGEVFDRNSYGPPVAFNVFQAICYKRSKKDRPIVNEDTWQSPAKREHPYYIISDARAFDKMMETVDQEKWLTLANNYLKMGRGLIPTQHTRSPIGKVKYEEAGDIPEITAENLTDKAFNLSPEQEEAIRYGAMYFAAAELGVYQKVETAKVEASTDAAAEEASDVLVNQTKLGEDLSEEQAAELKTELKSKIQGVLGAYAAYQAGQEGEKGQWIKGLEAGLAVPLLDDSIPGRLSLQWTVSGNSIIPVIRTTGGLVYQIDFGKEGRGHFEAYAKLTAGLSDPRGFIGPSAGVNVSRDLGENRIWSLGGGASIGLRKDGDIIGANFGLDRNLNRVLEKKIADFREEHADDLSTLRGEVHATIDGLKVDPVQKKILKEQYEKYMDQRIAYDETEDFTKWYKQVKLSGFGVTAAVGLKDGGFAVGPYITLGVGFRAQTLYVPPLETPEQVAKMGQTGLPTEIENYKVPEADWIKAEGIVDEVLWSGDAASQEGAYEAAEGWRETAFQTMQNGVKGDIEMTGGDKLTGIGFKQLNGRVVLFPDSRSGIEIIQDGPQNASWNLDSDDTPIVRIVEIPDAQGGDNVVIIGVTNDPNASIEDIMANSPSYLTWNQTLDGKKSDSVIVKNPNSTVDAEQDLLMTHADFDLGLDDGSIQLGDLSKEGAKQNVQAVRWEDLHNQLERETASERFSEEEKQMASELADELIKAGYGYKALIRRDKKEEIHGKITELYEAKGISPDEPEKKLVHQYAMEKTRPDHKNIPFEWNERAFKEIAGEVSTLATDYWKTKAEAGELSKEAFPEGSEFLVTISEDGTVIMLGGYYNKEIYGEVLAPVKWNTSNPEATLTEMGVEVNDENKKAVLGIAEAISKLDWEEKPLPGNPDFNTARTTMVGDKLLTTQYSNDLYGESDGAKLREMAASKNADLYPELAKEYAQDVANLLANKETMIRGNAVAIDWQLYSGLDDNCFNLTFARNVKLAYQQPEKKEIKAASTREKIEGGMSPEMAVTYQNIRVAPAVVPFRSTPDITTPASEGDSEQTTGQGIDPGAHIGEHIPELGGGKDDAGDF